MVSRFGDGSPDVRDIYKNKIGVAAKISACFQLPFGFRSSFKPKGRCSLSDRPVTFNVFVSGG